MIRQETVDDFEEIIPKGVGLSLGRPTPLSESTTLEMYTAPAQGGFIEITITHPETISWLKMSSEKQKKKLGLIFRYGISAIPSIYHASSMCKFEFSRRGQVHCHAYLDISDALKLYPIGVVSDIAKAILENMPKKYSKFVTANIHGGWCRYKSPQCVVQYRYLSEEDRIVKWSAYMKKLQ